MLAQPGMHRLHVLRASITSAASFSRRQKHLHLNTAKVPIMASSSAMRPEVYVHAPTTQELDAAKAALPQVSPLSFFCFS
jgi:hypothetical protein